MPRFGWEDTLAYLTIPLILICTQTVSLYVLGTFESLEAAEDRPPRTPPSCSASFPSCSAISP